MANKSIKSLIFEKQTVYYYEHSTEPTYLILSQQAFYELKTEVSKGGMNSYLSDMSDNVCNNLKLYFGGAEMKGMEEVRRIRIRQELTEEHRPHKYKLFNFVTKVTVSENADSGMVRHLSDLGIIANTKFTNYRGN